MLTTQKMHIEKARMATLAGDYEDALRITNFLIEKNPFDVESLILKGNTMELLLADDIEISDEVRQELSGQARSCYERALSIEPENIFALKDLADHLNEKELRQDALLLYEKLVPLLQGKKDLADELEEANIAIYEINQFLNNKLDFRKPPTLGMPEN